MTGNRNQRRSLSAILITLAVIAGCVPTTVAPPTTKTANVALPTTVATPPPTTKTPRELAELERWACCDFVGGCRSNPTAITLTVYDVLKSSQLVMERFFENNPDAPDVTKAKLHQDTKEFHEALGFDDKAGTITLAGSTSQNAKFGIKGLERHWHWGLNEKSKGYDYTFTISPDGMARYYDFTASKDGRAKPRDLFRCERR